MEHFDLGIELLRLRTGQCHCHSGTWIEGLVDQSQELMVLLVVVLLYSCVDFHFKLKEVLRLDFVLVVYKEVVEL